MTNCSRSIFFSSKASTLVTLIPGRYSIVRTFFEEKSSKTLGMITLLFSAISFLISLRFLDSFV